MAASAASAAAWRKMVGATNPYLMPTPTQDDLPYSDGEPMESECHAQQLPLMKEPLMLHWKDRTDFYIGTNMYVYFSPDQQKTHDFKGPDVFVALDVKPRKRKSFLTWEEQVTPNVVIEFISPSTSKIDKGHKKDIYQNRLRVPEYFWNDPYEDDFAGFRLHDGKYKRLKPDANGMLHSAELGLALTRWQGVFMGVEGNWLRWATPQGILLPTGEELARINARRFEDEKRIADEQRARAEFEKKIAVEQRVRADAEHKRADALMELLKKHGIDPKD